MKIYTTKDEFWYEESGLAVPKSRVTIAEKQKEAAAKKIVEKATTASKYLSELKVMITEATDKILEAARKENNVKLEGKGNYTWFSFDRSVKIEVQVNETLKFDDILIASAKERLLELIRGSIQGLDFIITIVEEAFQTSKGQLDPKKILGLRRHSSRIPEGDFKNEWEEVMKLIDDSITRTFTKKYQRVFVKDAAGEYKAIELNFSAL